VGQSIIFNATVEPVYSGDCMFSATTSLVPATAN